MSPRERTSGSYVSRREESGKRVDDDTDMHRCSEKMRQ